MVSCSAYAKTGEVVEGRTAVELNNTAFETLAVKGVVLVFSELDPRFPEPGPTGASTQRVRLWHTYSRPVRIEHLRRKQLVLGKDTPDEEVSLDELGVSVIGPGQIVEARPFHFDGEKLPDVYGLEYHVEGTTDDDWPARGNFAIMRPAKPPTPAEHTPVIDPVLKAKILRARTLLGKPYVTDEDIWRLEGEGRGAITASRSSEPSTAPRSPSIRSVRRGARRSRPRRGRRPGRSPPRRHRTSSGSRSRPRNRPTASPPDTRRGRRDPCTSSRARARRSARAR